jgi:putative N6-adenine-specific DNA methylase
MELVIKTLTGLEQVLAREIEELGGTNIKVLKRGVACEGNLAFVYKANYNLRTALRILVPIYRFRARREDDLYDKVLKHDWSQYLGVGQTFAIDNTIFSDFFTHSKFVALKTKDAMVDQFRNKFGERPSVDVENPSIKFNLHVYQDDFTISLDSSGEPLNQRGYRKAGHEAPMNEVLAAGLLKLANWTPDKPLVDPMCGSGTILIEAGMMAKNIPPQFYRKHFAFKNWRDFNPILWNRIKSESQPRGRVKPYKILGGDIDPKAVKITQSSADKLGLAIEVAQLDFEKQKAPFKSGMIVTNPPYGERIGDDVLELYKKLGDTLKHQFVGWEAWIISSNKDALKQLRLKPTESMHVYNGSLDCEYCKYDLFEGSGED